MFALTVCATVSFSVVAYFQSWNAFMLSRPESSSLSSSLDSKCLSLNSDVLSAAPTSSFEYLATNAFSRFSWSSSSRRSSLNLAPNSKKCGLKSFRGTFRGSASTTCHTRSSKQSGILGPTMFCSKSLGTSQKGSSTSSPIGRSRVWHILSISFPRPVHPLLNTTGHLVCSARKLSMSKYLDIAAVSTRSVAIAFENPLGFQIPR